RRNDDEGPRSPSRAHEKEAVMAAWSRIALASLLASCVAGGFGGVLRAESDADDRDEVEIVGVQPDGRELLPTGKSITPTAAPGSTYQQLTTELRQDGNADANGAYTSALSPDGRTLLVLTNGYNTNFMTPDGKKIQFPYLDPATGKPSSVESASYQW